MALSRVKTWIAGEVLTASDLNSEFNNILNNAASLFSPLSGTLDLDGNTLILDAAGVTTVASSSAASWTFASGAKSGTPGTTGTVSNWGSQTFTDSATAASGTAAAYVAFAIQRPTLAATNATVTTTDAATLYIPNAPAAGSNETLTNAWALWIDDGAVRYDLTNSKASATSATLRSFYLPAATQTITGSTAITTAAGLNLIEIERPTYSAASALTITNAATLYLANAPLAGGAGPATITNTYTLWVDDGAVRFDGGISGVPEVASAASAILDALSVTARTVTITGSTGITTATGFNHTNIGIPTLSAASALTITNAATLYIAGAPAAAGAGPATITNAYSLWVDAGVCRFDGPVIAQGLYSGMRGFTYANGAVDAVNDIDIAAGGAMDSTNAYWIEGAALTKQLDAAWAVGTNAGGLDTGSIGNSDYYIHAIARPDTGVVDYLFSLSATAPTMPTSYTFRRLIGWFRRLAAVNVLFDTYQTEGGGIEMNWRAPTLDINLANTLTTSRRTDALPVPLNFSVEAHITVSMTDAASAFLAWICCPDQTDAAPSGNVAPLANYSMQVVGATFTNQLFIRTSATGTIAARATIATVDLYAVSTMGFRWSRR